MKESFLKYKSYCFFWGLALIVMLSAPCFIAKSYIYVACQFLIMALFANSLNLLLGYAGLVSFGHAAFFGTGGYTIAVLMTKASFPMIPSLVAVPVVAALLGIVIGYFCVRLSGVYFAILALAFSQLVYYVIYGWYGFTGGDNGLFLSIPGYILPMRNYYYFTLAIVAGSLLLLHRIVSSPFGKIIQAIREDSQRALFAGINVKRLRLVTFIVSGAFCSVAGALMVMLQRMAFPDIAGFHKSFEPILMCLLGGIYNFWGPVLGAGIFVFLDFALSTNTEYSLFVLGLLVLITVIAIPGGLIGFIKEKVIARFSRSILNKHV